MKYYVTADVHGYFSEWKQVLEEQGFFREKTPHKLHRFGTSLTEVPKRCSCSRSFWN